jgi:prepilin-type N-terminal cleavage/methylation domain-containing protein
MIAPNRNLPAAARRRRPSEAGFTLIEILLALGILAVVLAMLSSAFNIVAHSKQHAENRMAANQAGAAILAQMSREIRGTVAAVSATTALPNAAVPVPQMFLLGQGRTTSGIPVDSLTISTADAGHRPSLFSFGSEDLVTYSAQANPDHRGWYLLTRSQQSALIPPQAGNRAPLQVVLADNVLSLHLRYFNGQTWNESWDSRANSQMPLPPAIQIDLELAAPGGLPLDFSTQVAVPMASLAR